MLARANRVRRPEDFRTALRRGRRVTNGNTVIHIFERDILEPARFGFIVTKAVGGAVVRNRVRRRLRAACFELLPTAGEGRDIVIRALPGSDRADWASLHSEIADGVGRGRTQG